MTAGWFFKNQMEYGTHLYITIFQVINTTLVHRHEASELL